MGGGSPVFGPGLFLIPYPGEPDKMGVIVRETMGQFVVAVHSDSILAPRTEPLYKIRAVTDSAELAQAVRAVLVRGVRCPAVSGRLRCTFNGEHDGPHRGQGAEWGDG